MATIMAVVIITAATIMEVAIIMEIMETTAMVDMAMVTMVMVQFNRYLHFLPLNTKKEEQSGCIPLKKKIADCYCVH